MRIGFVQWPEALSPGSAEWTGLAEHVAMARLDLLVTNELPFGRWIAEDPAFDPHEAQASIDIHAAGLASLAQLDVPAILSSRPAWSGERLVNEAFVLNRGVAGRLHHKRYLPDEPGWFETSWYRGGPEDYNTVDIGGIRVGALLCTEAMFNEHARGYGRQGADLIAIPRATGTSLDAWLAAGKMAAIVSGSYVVSSNRVGLSRGGLMFGGAGFAFHPDGTLIAMTTASDPLLAITLDPAVSARQRKEYPCYVQVP